MNFTCLERKGNLQLNWSFEAQLDSPSTHLSGFGRKMLRQRSCSSKLVLLIFVLFGFFRKLCDGQVDREEANKTPDGADGAGGAAFFALRSCHQLLHGNSGEFFSPDYLCSNPSLWCNWTIQVDPGKRIHLRLGDLTPDDACHLKQDQIHVDEPTGPFGVHGILETCWREARYTSSSNTLYVVLLIGGWPSPPYRGFYGRYQAFGPPVAFNPQEGFTGGGRQSTPSAGLLDLNEPGADTNGGKMGSEYLSTVSALSYDYYYYNQPSVRSAELPWGAEDSGTEVYENLHVYPVTAAPIVPASTLETSQSGRGVASTLASQAVSQDHRLKRTTNTLTAIRRHVEDASNHLEEAAVLGDETNTQSWTEPKSNTSEQAGGGENQTGIDEDSDQNPSPSEEPEPEEPHPHPNMVEPLSDHRENPDVRNHSVSPHLPGDHLFEVAVEVNFSQDLEESWNNQVKSLLLSVKNLINQQLEPLHMPLSMSSKRLKRLKAGVLYILWLQTGPAPRGPEVHKTISSILQGLIATNISSRAAVIFSVSTEDVNECGTQLVLCDVNADCVNQFGTYSCRCRPGFQDRSRLGSGGTICVDLKAAGCGSGLSAETKGVYVLFFLLSSLFLVLVVAAAMMYHRHHRGAFLVRCHSNSSSNSFSPPDHNNNQPDHSCSCPAGSHLPPPPVPARGPRGGWTQGKEGSPAIDLRLLRFSPLQPPDGCQEPQEGGKT